MSQFTPSQSAIDALERRHDIELMQDMVERHGSPLAAALEHFNPNAALILIGEFGTVTERYADMQKEALAMAEAADVRDAERLRAAVDTFNIISALYDAYLRGFLDAEPVTETGAVDESF